MKIFKSFGVLLIGALLTANVHSTEIPGCAGIDKINLESRLHQYCLERKSDQWAYQKEIGYQNLERAKDTMEAGAYYYVGKAGFMAKPMTFLIAGVAQWNDKGEIGGTIYKWKFAEKKVRLNMKIMEDGSDGDHMDEQDYDLGRTVMFTIESPLK